MWFIMTYFISPEYQKLPDAPSEPSAEKSDYPPDLITEHPEDFLRGMKDVSDDFKEVLLCLDEPIRSSLIRRAGALGRDQWPNDITRHNLIIQAEAIWTSSRQCSLAFLDSAPTALAVLSRGEFNHWVTIGQGILESDLDSVELALAYFRTSPHLIEARAFNFIYGWVEQIRLIASLSLKTAIAFCRATPAFVIADRAFHLRKWAEMVRQILGAGKDCETVAIAFIESGTQIVQDITFKELISWGSIGVKIARNFPGPAFTYFSEPPEGITSLYNIEIVKFLDLMSLLVDSAFGRAMEFYQRCPAELVSLNPRVRESVLDIAGNLAVEGPEEIIDVFNDIISALQALFFPIQEKVIESGAAIGLSSLQASRTYFKSVGRVLNEISEPFLAFWIEKGLARLTENEQAGTDYFALKSEESRVELSKWKAAVLLDDHKQALSVFAHALSGRKLQLKKRRGQVSGKGMSRRRFPAMDDKTIFLPAFFAEEPDRQGNYRLYKVTLAHHAGHIEFGTFAPPFRKIVPLILAFPITLLARDIFFIIENGRIDFLLRREYRGLKEDIDQTVADCMARRTYPVEDPLAEALEILLRLTLGCLDETCVSREMQGWTHDLKNSMNGFFENAPGVWASFQKMVELYGSFSRLAVEDLYIPGSPLPFRGRPDLDIFSDGTGNTDASGETEDSDTGTDNAIHPLSEEDIKRLLEKLKDPKFLQDLKEDPLGEGIFITQVDGPTRTDLVEESEEEAVGDQRIPEVSPSGSSGHEGPFYYDEWDYQQQDYRRKWCTLWERSVPENNLGLFDKIYNNYSDLILKVRQQFQRIRPEVLEIVRREEWGPEIDFNAMIQSVVDRKVGDAPSDRIFMRMEKRVRRISTVLLVDMSASTDRLVSRVNPPDHAQQASSGKTLPDPIAQTACQEKKVIDIEMEGLVVITEALQSLGDDYGIFGFSGYGREQVDFYTIKDFDDRYSETMKSRICGIQPQKGTRMGPAIRHAVEKLNRVGGDHQLLVLLSDGFPQDLDYGEDRSSKDYGLHDTMMALAEARRFGIRPFCITVDLAGDDYLRQMWDPGSYLIVNDVYALPEVLPRVVESLVL